MQAHMQPQPSSLQQAQLQAHLQAQLHAHLQTHMQPPPPTYAYPDMPALKAVLHDTNTSTNVHTNEGNNFPTANESINPATSVFYSQRETARDKAVDARKGGDDQQPAVTSSELKLLGVALSLFLFRYFCLTLSLALSHSLSENVCICVSVCAFVCV